MKRYRNEKGISLVEVIAVLAITAIIGGLLYTVLMTFLNTQKDVTADTLLRDEADYYIANLINYLYTLNESDVCGGLNKSADANDPSTFIRTRDTSGNCSENSPITGFFLHENVFSLFVDGDEISQQNTNVQIDESSHMEKEENVYKITLTLNYGDETESFFTEIHSINDN